MEYITDPWRQGNVPPERSGCMDKRLTYEKPNGEWILCSEKLPPEPGGNSECMTTEELEQLIINHILKEYIVTIYGAGKSTVLVYAGNGKWYDGITQEYYKVMAWMQMPEVYSQEGERK